jgi:hypothetical protein
MAFNYSPKIITDSLVFAIDAANKKSYPGSGTTWSDLSGNGNNGTLINGPTFDSGNGGYIELDGTNDYIDTPFNATSYFPLTICAWVNIDDTSGVQIITDQSSGAAGLGLRTNNAAIDAFWRNGDVINLETIISSYSADSWIYVCVVYNTNSMVGYMNGVVQNSYGSANINLTSANRGIDNTNGLHIGNQNDQINNHIDAKIAQVKIYNKALTANEILQNYNALKSRFGL